MEFYCHPEFHGVIPEPKPASKFIPEWFKKIPPTIPDEKGRFNEETFTAKKCMPILDAMSYGYVIPLQGDLGVRTNVDRSAIEVFNPPELKVAEFHSIKQLGERTAPGFPAPAIKFINRWVVKTAPGWSTLFMPLINEFDDTKHFTCISGLVDTDRYPKEVNFPAIWHTPNFEDRLPAGTPLVVAIPVKRDSMLSKPIVREMTTQEYNDIDIIRKKQDSRLHVYTKELRESRK